MYGLLRFPNQSTTEVGRIQIEISLFGACKAQISNSSFTVKLGRDFGISNKEILKSNIYQ